MCLPCARCVWPLNEMCLAAHGMCCLVGCACGMCCLAVRERDVGGVRVVLFGRAWEMCWPRAEYVGRAECAGCVRNVLAVCGMRRLRGRCVGRAGDKVAARKVLFGCAWEMCWPRVGNVLAVLEMCWPCWRCFGRVWEMCWLCWRCVGRAEDVLAALEMCWPRGRCVGRAWEMYWPRGRCVVWLRAC
jgi:hypothetical protein